MRVRRLVLAAALCVTVSVAAPVVAPVAAPATAAALLPSQTLAITGLGELLHDPVTGRLLLTQGSTAPVVVLDAVGREVGRLSGRGLTRHAALETGGGTAWVAAPDRHALLEVDLSDLEVVEHPTGEGSCPGDVTLSEGLVWFADDCGTAPVAALDPTTDEVTPVQPSTGAVEPLRNWRLGADERLPGRMLAIASGESRTYLTRLAVTGGVAPALQEEVGTFTFIDPVSDRSPDPLSDGTLLTAGGATYVGDGFTYGPALCKAAGTAAAVRADDVRASGSADGLQICPPGSNAVSAAHRLPGQLLPGGLVFGARDLYAVTRDGGGRFALTTVSTRAQPRLTVTASKSQVRWAARIEVAVRVTRTVGNPMVSLYAVSPAGTRLVGTSRRGSFRLPYQVRDNTRFVAQLTADALNDGAQDASGIVRASVVGGLRVQGGQRRANGDYRARAGRPLLLVGRVQPARPGYRMKFYLEGRQGTRWVSLGYTDYGTVDSRGRAAVRLVGTERLVGRELRISTGLRIPGGRRPTLVPLTHVLLRITR